MSIVEYFDVQNIEHLKAYQHLQNTGSWPENFYDTMTELNIDIPIGWSLLLTSKLADAYINLKLGS